MEGHYDVIMADKVIGKAKVSIEGLYYHFKCHCDLSGGTIHKIKAVCADIEYDLGVCVPVGDKFGIDTKVPIKKIGQGELSFYAVPRKTDREAEGIPIRTDEPFMCIERLQNARLAYFNGEPFIRMDCNGI